MAVRLIPQWDEVLRQQPAPERDAEIISFPVTEWDRLELWRRRQDAKEARSIKARNDALKRI